MPASDDDLTRAVVAALSKTHGFLRFDRLLAERYEADTRSRRVRGLRRMIVLGLLLFTLFDFSGFVTLPHFGWMNVGLRTCVITPIGLGIAAVIGQVNGRWREALVGLGSMGATAIPMLLFSISNEPLTPFMSAEVILSLVYANTTLGIRFSWACLNSAVMIGGMLVSLYFKGESQLGLSGVITLYMTTGMIFSLTANYRIERSSRYAYLLALNDSLRVEALASHNETLTHLSCTDALTGMFNRRFLAEKMSGLGESIRHGRRVAVLLADVDHFKMFNDHHGHGAGDECLRRLSAVFRRECRDDHHAIRFGGEEFLFLLYDVTSTEAVAFAERLCAGVSSLGLGHAGRPDQLTHVTISVGVAGTHDHGCRSIDDLIQAADAALYMAKSLGRNRFCVAANAGAEAETSPFEPSGPPSYQLGRALARA